MTTNDEYMKLKVLRKHRLSLRKISELAGMAVNTVLIYLSDEPPVMKILEAYKSKFTPLKHYLANRIQEAKRDWIPETGSLRETAEQGNQCSIRSLQELLQKLRP